MSAPERHGDPPRHDPVAYATWVRREIVEGRQSVRGLIVACNRSLPPSDARLAIGNVLLPLFRGEARPW